MKKPIFLFCLVCFISVMLFSFYRIYTIYKPTKETLETIETFTATKSSTNEVKRKRIALIIPGSLEEQMNPIKAGAARIANKLSIHLDVKTTLNANVNEMVNEMNMAIASKVDGIIVYGIDHISLSRAIRKSTEKGIPVITIGNDVPLSLRKTYVGTDHVLSGKLIATALVEKLKESGKVAIIGKADGSAVYDQRLVGAMDVLNKYPNIELVYATHGAEDQQLNSQQIINNVLNEYPKVNAIVALDGMNIPHIVSILSMRTNKDHHLIYSFDDTNEVYKLMKENVVDGTIKHDYEAIGQQSISLLVQWLHADNLPLPTRKYTPTKLIQSDRKESKNNE